MVTTLPAQHRGAARVRACRILLATPARRALTVFPFLLSVLVLTGCGGITTADVGEAPEHHVPEHRPRDLPAALRQIDQYASTVRGALTRPPTAEEDRAHDEFLKLQDVVRWLPDIAGDSDLPEAEWNEVHQAAGELQALLEPIHAALHGTARDDAQLRLSRLDAILRRLSPVADHPTMRPAAGEPNAITAREPDTP